MAASGAAAAPDMSQYITRVEAQSEIGRLVKEQLEQFSAQREVVVEQSQVARDTFSALAIEVDLTLKRNKADCEAQIAQQVGELRTQAQTSVSTVTEKIAEIESLFKVHTASQEDAELKLTKHVADMTELEEKLRVFAQGVEANLVSIHRKLLSLKGESAARRLASKA